MRTWSNAIRSECVSLGDFGIGRDAPIFAHLPNLFPLSQIQPTITFYMKKGRKTKEILRLDHTSVKRDVVKNSNFVHKLDQQDNREILVTHGFLSGADEDWIIKMRDALLTVEKQVVAIVGKEAPMSQATASLTSSGNRMSINKQPLIVCRSENGWGRLGSG